MTDSTLVQASATDFESATIPHLDAIARFALSLTRDRADADDLVQETYLRAFRGWRTFRPGSDARRWLFAICRNAFLRSRRRRRTLVESQDGDLDAMPAVLTHIQAMHDGLGELFEVLDVRPAVERAIGELPEPHHTVLVLVDLEEHSYQEAAAILNMNEFIDTAVSPRQCRTAPPYHESTEGHHVDNYESPAGEHDEAEL